MFDDLRALVEFARAGSIAGAADRLYRTPSAITRQLQRLEAALGAELLDRSVKPPRLNSLGSRVLEQARDLLQRTEALKSLTSSDAEPHGLLRIGLSHPLAEGTLIGPILALTETYPRVRLRLLSELTAEHGARRRTEPSVAREGISDPCRTGQCQTADIEFVACSARALHSEKPTNGRERHARSDRGCSILSFATGEAEYSQDSAKISADFRERRGRGL